MGHGSPPRSPQQAVTGCSWCLRAMIQGCFIHTQSSNMKQPSIFSCLSSRWHDVSQMIERCVGLHWYLAFIAAKFEVYELFGFSMIQLTRWMMSTRRTAVATERRRPRRPKIYETCCFSMWFRTFSSLFKAVSFENSSWWYPFSLQAPVSTLDETNIDVLNVWMCFTFLMDTY